MNYSVDDAEAFEQAWLLLIEIYIQGGKYDLAQDLAKKCIKYNKSCGKAWEYIGIILEKEYAYKNAADKYFKAWKLGNKTDPQLGFRLAFNYLKAKRNVEAIDVCHKVLQQFPDCSSLSFLCHDDRPKPLFIFYVVCIPPTSGRENPMPPSIFFPTAMPASVIQTT